MNPHPTTLESQASSQLNESGVRELKMSRTRSPQKLDVELERAQGIASRCLADAMGIHRCSLESFAAAAGVSPTYVRRWVDAGDDSTITTKRLIVAAKTRPRVVITFLASLRSHLDNEVAAEPRIPIHSRVLSVMSEVGELSEAVRESLQDGVVVDAERTRILREIEHAQAALNGLAGELRRA